MQTTTCNSCSQCNCNQCKHNSCDCHKQKHVHQITGSTEIFRECDDCHNHNFCTVSGEAIHTKDKQDHYHEVIFRTDFSDGHYHEFYGKTGGKVDVGNGKHIHYLKDCTKPEDCHKHGFQFATLIDSPTTCKDR